MAPRAAYRILWVLVAAFALAVSQDVPQGPCTHGNPPPTEEECLEHCGCVYCYPPEDATSAGVGPGDAARAHEKTPAVGCADWIHRDRCAGNYSTDYDSDRCKHSRHMTQMTFIVFVSVIVGCLALYGLVLFGAWVRREYCARATYVRMPDG